MTWMNVLDEQKIFWFVGDQSVATNGKYYLALEKGQVEGLN